jgi:hypothetical protein
VALIRTNVSEDRIASIIRVKRISHLGTTLTVTSLRSVLQLPVSSNVVPSSLIVFTLMMEAILSSEMSRAIRRHISEGGILHSHRRENRLGSVAET